MRIPMKAKQRFVYAGHNIRPGQQFEAHSESNARFLTQVGRADRVIPAGTPTYQTRALVAAPPVQEVTVRSSTWVGNQSPSPFAPTAPSGAAAPKRSPGRPRAKKIDE